MVDLDNIVPDLVPARMVNEFSYCPRLFFLEWVDAQFADSDDTVEGRWQHRAVDEQAGAVPLSEEGIIKVARSVALSSTSLGLIGVVDLLEGTDEGEVVPVDTKKGLVAPTPEMAWEPDRVQVCVQGLLLRENGYQCTHGVLWFAGSRQRVIVSFDDVLIKRTLELVAQLRMVAASSVAPAPLLDSPKCPRCSLVGICLPDEVNMLSARTESIPRRLIPRDRASRPLYVTQQGAFVSKEHGRIEIRKDKDKLDSVRMLDVSQLCLYGNIQVSSQLVRELLTREIPICWFSFGGWFTGMATGLPGRNVELRRRQVIVAAQGGLDIARRIVTGKIHNSHTLLRRNSKNRPKEALDQLKNLATEAGEADSFQRLLGIEGAAARTYFGAFSTMLREDKAMPGGIFTFEGRNRRPPTDPINCMLGYVYGLLVKELTATAFAIGFDPYLGFYHRPRFGRPALALDLAEEFRPIVAESVVINLVNNGEVSAEDFVVRAGGVMLTPSGKTAVIRGYERRLAGELTHPVFGYRATYRRILEVQLRLLAAHLLGEIPEYIPIVTR